MSKPKRPVVAFAYDFDGTLAPGNMQEHSFLPAVAINKAAFWKEVDSVTKESDGDNILIYLKLMLDAAAKAKVPISRNSFRDHGKAVKLFSGVDTWFDRVNKMAADRGLVAEHYIVSSGVREMIEGTTISKKFKKIFASSYHYDENGVAQWPALAINYTNKTQFMFRINKGTLDVWDNSQINKYVAKADRAIPFERMVFVGDGETDIPCMKLVTDQGGYAVAVYPPNKKGAREKVQSLIDEGRAKFIAKADYSEGSGMEKLAEAILNDVSAKAALDRASHPT